MRWSLSIGVTLAAVAFAAFAHAGQIWTDGDGDGLPDAGPLPATPSTNVTVGVWIDAQSFNWTNFLAYVEWSSDCISYVSASYVIGGVAPFPIDNFSHPRGIGFGGSGANEGGVDQIGNVTLHVNAPVSCCVTPIIDIYNPYGVFSQLGAGAAYMLFTTNPGTCYGTQEPAGACCLPDGSCQVMLALDCQAAGGVYQGDGLSCAMVDCPQPPQTEACCFPCGGCQNLPPEECAAAGGVSQGARTACGTPGVCALPPCTGACCFESFTCIDGLTEADCFAAGGSFWFQDLTCAQVPICTEPDAVESKSWGKIKGLFR